MKTPGPAFDGTKRLYDTRNVGLTLLEPLQTTKLECDVLVAGGGMSGVACALAAARYGARVVLCQDRPVLGGNASSEIRMHVVGANSGRPCRDAVLEARETGIIEEIRLENAFRNPQRSPSVFDLILYEKCFAQNNLTLLLNTSISATEVEGNRIQRVTGLRLSTEDRFDISAAVFVDCTGDGRLAALAGAAFMFGREDKTAYGEGFALPEADGKTLGSTLLFMGRKHAKPMPFVPPPWARKVSESDLKFRTHATPEIDAGLEYGYWWIEWGGQLNTIRDNERIRHELLAVVLGVWDHIKNTGHHGAEHWALDWFGMVPGKRESRRLLGQYVLRESDLLGSTPFADAIAFGGWPIDLHPPEGIDRTDEPPCTAHPVPYLYDIPLRCCVARDFSNLMFAGRNISATHVAFASTRVMATCAVIGEGVGVSAAHAVRAGLPPAKLASSPDALQAIQRRLLRGDVFLIGQSYADPIDLARWAAITASSAHPESPARNLVSGQNRALIGERGVSPSRQSAGTHRWRSEPTQGLPAWVELRWSEAVSIGEVALVFDTGLHRHLTLTQSDEYHKLMCWGSGQPEMVKHFEIHVDTEIGWQSVWKIDGQWQRCVRHEFKPAVKSKALRITIHEMWGVAEARVIRVSVYPPEATP